MDSCPKNTKLNTKKEICEDINIEIMDFASFYYIFGFTLVFALIISKISAVGILLK